MPFDDVADFAAGVCASAIKPANDTSASPMKEALKKFMSAFVFRTSRHVQSHHYRLVFAIRIPTRSLVGSPVGHIRMQSIGFAGMAAGMLVLVVAVGLTNSSLHISLVFAGFIMFNLLMNAGPNSTTFTLAPILFPTQLRGTASGFAAGVAKLGATFGVFLLPILKEKFGVPSVLGIVSAVSLPGLVVTLILGREDTE